MVGVFLVRNIFFFAQVQSKQFKHNIDNCLKISVLYTPIPQKKIIPKRGHLNNGNYKILITSQFHSLMPLAAM